LGKKKVLIFVTQLLETGGIESHLKEFCLQFKESNIQVSILILNSKASIQTHSFYKEVCENAWIISDSNTLIRYLKLFLLIPFVNFNGFTTFYSNGQGDSIFYIKKLLFTIKNWVHHHHTSGDFEDQKTWTNKYLKTLYKASEIVACANYNAKLMSQKLNRNVISIPCFSREIFVQSKNINPSKIKIAYFGRLIKEKGIEAICKLSTLETFKHVEFIIWGEGSLYPVSYFNLFPNVSYMGSFKNKEELKNILNNIDAFMLYSTHPEGLPISLLEVMGAGIPWIATNIGGIGELSVDSKLNYLLPQKTNFDELVQHLLKFTNHLVNEPSVSLNQIATYKNKYASEVVKNNWTLVLKVNN
jgi:glycosyltransferase involved in cell wall biosynthesis